jgi:uncharacterized membrane protein (UPF0127 family)
MTQPAPRKFLTGTQIISLVAIIAVAGLLLKVGCDRARITSAPNTGLGMVEMTIGSRQFNLEIANDEETRVRGLMRRDSMPEDHGMIFVFDEAQDLSFWMKNTRIPLDIIYVAGDGRVVSVKSMKPYSTTPVASDGVCKYAIELNAGMAEAAGVHAGDRLTIPPAARDTAR